MITKESAMAAKHGDLFYTLTTQNEPLRWRVNGKCRVWKRTPEAFKLPLKRGLYDYGYIDQFNCQHFFVSPCAAVVEGP